MLSDEELNILLSLNNSETDEPDGQPRIAIKQAFIVGLARKLEPYFAPTIYRYENPKNDYNQPDHLVAGKRISVMDRSAAIKPETAKQEKISKPLDVDEPWSLGGGIAIRF
ncbi:MAG TPA: hypothetical protein VJA47_00140 [archaeon]|nr:hypothetical protein [archaeon]